MCRIFCNWYELILSLRSSKEGTRFQVPPRGIRVQGPGCTVEYTLLRSSACRDRDRVKDRGRDADRDRGRGRERDTDREAESSTLEHKARDLRTEMTFRIVTMWKTEYLTIGTCVRALQSARKYGGVYVLKVILERVLYFGYEVEIYFIFLYI